MPIPGEQFLHQKDSTLHTSKYVEHEQARKRMARKETSLKPADKISDWLKVIEQTHTGHRGDPRVLERIKDYYRKTYVIKPKDIPESTFLLEQRIAREEGHGTIEITDEFKEKKIQQIIADQRASLDRWVHYLSSPDAKYPMWAKYWAFTSMLKMGKFEKVEKKEGDQTTELGRFINRTKDTVASFPILNPRALALTVGVIEKKIKQNSQSKKEQVPIENPSVKLKDPEFQALLSTENFSKLYAQFLIEMPEYSTEGLQETRGKWVTYERNSDPTPLVDSLEGYPLEWCTANIDTARTQLEGGDFHVYYSIDENGQAVIPRLAIRMQDSKIAELRGIAHDQNIDPYIGDVLEKKLDDFPDKEQFKKRSADMKRLTAIEKKIQSNQDLAKDDLIFLYEVDSSIEGFGYEKDPRIKELRDVRDPIEDAPIALGCKPEEIAWSQSDFQKNSKRYKVYIGPLFKGIFSDYPNLEHVYISFPEKKVREVPPVDVSLEIIQKDGMDICFMLGKEGMQLYKHVVRLFVNETPGGEYKTFEQTKLKKPETIDLVRLTVNDLFGDGIDHTTDEIYKKAIDFGLELCPSEVGPLYRIAYKDQPIREYLWIAMEQISDSDGSPVVFRLYHDDYSVGIDSSSADPNNRWDPDCVFVFRLRK